MGKSTPDGGEFFLSCGRVVSNGGRLSAEAFYHSWRDHGDDHDALIDARYPDVCRDDEIRGSRPVP